MKWYGYFAMVLSTVGLAAAASAVEPGEWTQQETSSRRTAGQAVERVARMTTEPFYNNAYNGSANMAPGVLGWGMGGGGYGGNYNGGYAYGGPVGGRDLSGWGSCDCSAPCASHLWSGYFQRPRRCDYPQQHAHGCTTCIKSCTSTCDNPCNTCNTGCHHGGAKQFFTRFFAGLKCGSPACNSCSAPVGCSKSVGCGKGVDFAPSHDAPGDAPPAPEAAPRAPEPTSETFDYDAAYQFRLPTLRSSRPIGSGLQ